MKIQQCTVLLSAVLASLLGLSLVLVAKAFMEPDIVLTHTEPRFVPAVLAIGSASLAAGCLGMLGACCSSRSFLCLFAIVSLAASACGTLVGGVLLATVNTQGEELKRSCLAMTDDVHETSSGMTQHFQSSYDSMLQGLKNCRQNDRPDALGLRDCGLLAKDDEGRWFADDPNADLFSWLEDQFGCAGFCKPDLPLFAFPLQSSAGRGPPVDQSSKLRRRTPCAHPFAGELEFRGSRAAGLTLLFSLPLVAAVFLASWIVCYPPPKTRKNYVHQSSQDSGDEAESDRLLAGGWGSDGD